MIKNPGRVLREKLAKPGILMAPGVYDGISARVVEQAGFELAYQTGAGVAAGAIAQPDIGLTTMNDTVNVCRALAMKLNIPLICDADTGYGNALNAIRTVHEFEMAGAAAIQMEDQAAPKRCGHLSGKTVIPADEYLQKLKAVLKERYYADTVVVARTDARAAVGFDDAAERAKRYIDAGADVLFFEAPQSVEEIEKVAKLFARQIPVLINQVIGGRTPELTAGEFEQLGFKIVIFPSIMPYYASVKLREAADRIMADKTDRNILPGGDGSDMFRTMGLAEWQAKDREYRVD
ncbi:MAG: isocitrate lyase/PEP mutase family protein [Clostridiales Family XIII bacterium]|jgi:2-methylisocitrate lyase-like PEP mutase family enzyme|nr:isocitrate lyase/PEP mutase family protein [Clostridiales Family XIII bacterium]